MRSFDAYFILVVDAAWTLTFTHEKFNAVMNPSATIDLNATRYLWQRQALSRLRTLHLGSENMSFGGDIAFRVSISSLSVRNGNQANLRPETDLQRSGCRLFEGLLGCNVI